MTHTLIYPHTARHNASGHLEIGGRDVVDLAGEYGTPLFIYDEQTLRDQCRAYHAAFAALTDAYEIVYASKAFSCRAMCELIAQEDLSIDVATGGELAAAVAAGFPSERIYFHGNNKSAAEIEAALDARIGHFVIDSFEEIDRVEAAAGACGLVQEVLVRVTPGVRPNTHDFVQTGQQDSKFGLGLADGRAHEAVRRIHAALHLQLVGVHAHIGSQIFELDSYRREVEVLFVAIDHWRRDFGFECRIFNIGGGLGIRYTNADMPSSIAEFAGVSVQAVQEGAARNGWPCPGRLCEPGRSMAGKGAGTAYPIGTVKGIPGVRTYVAADGGMSDNLRPMLYASRYEAMVANKAEQPATEVVTIAGKHCESGDVLIRDIHIASPEPGDILVTPSTGAYGYAMANNYNAQPRPAVVLVRDGESRIMIERETWADVLRLQRPLV